MSEVPPWEALERPAPDSVTVDGAELRRGSRVRLRPRAGRDVLDLALAGKDAIVEGIDQDYEEKLYIAVTLEDDPGRDLGEERQPGHRFFFGLDEVEPLPEAPRAPGSPRVLVAGIGNVFLGDDGFGVEVAGRLGGVSMPPGVDVADFGIRGMDLAYALSGYDVAVLVDALPRGDAPGTVYLIEVDMADDGVREVDTHGMDPVKVLRLARELGEVPERVLVVGCEPATRMTGDEDDVVMELSEPVRAAVDEAAKLVESVVRDLVTPDGDERKV